MKHSQQAQDHLFEDVVKSNPLATFKHFYENFSQETLNQLNSVYSDDVVFTDPLHVINGLDRLKSYFQDMCSNLTECRFEFIDETIQDGRACYKWQMHYRHPKIKSNNLLKLSGASFITFTDKIDSHEDFYDMGAMLYEHLPILGSAIRLIKSRITKES